VLVNAGLGLLTLIAVIGLADRNDVATADPGYHGEPLPNVLTHSDGAPITNILPYSSTGEPLTGVLLYDQDGRPIEGLADSTTDGSTVEQVPGALPQPANAYPQQRHVLTWDEYGEQRAVPMPLPTAATSPGPAPAAPAAPTS